MPTTQRYDTSLNLIHAHMTYNSTDDKIQYDTTPEGTLVVSTIHEMRPFASLRELFQILADEKSSDISVLETLVADLVTNSSKGAEAEKKQKAVERCIVNFGKFEKALELLEEIDTDEPVLSYLIEYQQEMYHDGMLEMDIPDKIVNIFDAQFDQLLAQYCPGE